MGRERLLGDKMNFELTDIVGADTETNGVDTNNSKAFCIGFCNTKGQTLFLDFRSDPTAKSRAQEIFDKCEAAFHNAKFDVKVLENAGVYVRRFHDTYTMAFLLNEYHGSFKLDFLAEKYLGEKKWTNEQFEYWKKINKKDIELNGYINVPAEILIPYTISDCTQALKLYYVFLGGLEKNNLLEQYIMEIEFIKLIKEVERNGLKIDVVYGLQKYEELTLKVETLKSELQNKWKIENPNSPAQVLNAFIKNNCIITSTNKEQILSLAKLGNELAKTLLVYRQLSKLVSGFLIPILEATDKDTRRVRTNFNTTVAKTGRLSSGNPINFQNFPRPNEDEGDVRNVVRSLIIPDTDYYLIGGDYDQEEMRIVADECKCTQLIELFKANTNDIYVEIAKLIWHQEKVDKQTRYVAKQSTLGMSYGMGAAKFVEQAKRYGFNLDEADAREVIGVMKSRFPEISGTLQELAHKAKHNGFVTDRFGKQYHVPSEFAYKALNAVIQGTAAQIMKRSMLELYKNVFPIREKFRIISTVHDEVLCEVHNSIDVDWAWNMIKMSMEKVSEYFQIPIKMSPKFFDKNWAKLRKDKE